jgi:hypothetical protein
MDRIEYFIDNDGGFKNAVGMYVSSPEDAYQVIINHKGSLMVPVGNPPRFIENESFVNLVTTYWNSWSINQKNAVIRRLLTENMITRDEIEYLNIDRGRTPSLAKIYRHNPNYQEQRKKGLRDMAYDERNQLDVDQGRKPGTTHAYLKIMISPVLATYGSVKTSGLTEQFVKNYWLLWTPKE